MACWNKRRYYCVSDDDTTIYGRNEYGILYPIENLPWSKPYLFRQVKAARQISEKHGLEVRAWRGPVYRNLPTDNQ